MIREISMSNTLSQPLFDILIPVDTAVSLATPERLNISMGGSFMPVIGFDLKAEFFTDILSNPVLMDSSWQGDFRNQSNWLMAYKKGSISGIDLSVEKRSPGIRGMAKYRFSRAKLTDQSDIVISMPGHREHEFYFIVDGDYGEKMGYRFDLTLASGKHFLKKYPDWELSSPYHRIDVSLYRDISWGGVNGKASLRIFNLTNNYNSEGEFDDSNWVINSLQDRAFVLLPFTPTLNIEFVF